MAGSQPAPLHSPSELRREAQSLLNEAIRSEAPDMRRHLLAASYELIQRAEMMSESSQAPAVELPFPHDQRASYPARA
jgi:hypothetical protein